MIKQRKQNDKTKVVVSLTLVCLMFVAVITAVILINAFPNQAFESSVKVSYYTNDITADVRAWYQEKEGVKTYLTTTKGGYDTTLKLDANDNGTQAKELFMDKDIVLTGSNNYVIFCYEFKNTGSKTFAGEHDFVNAIQGMNPTNMSVSYSLDGVTYDTVNTGFSVAYNNTQKYYFKIEVIDLAFDAELIGAISWDLAALKNSTTGTVNANDVARIGSTTYATFVEAYEAAESGDIVTINEDVVLPANFQARDNVTIVAEPKSGISAQSTDDITITLSGSVTLDKKSLKIGANNGTTINLTSNNTSIGDLFLISGNSLLKLNGVKFTPAENATSQRAAYIKESTFAMSGGELSGFKHSDGGAIYFEKGTGEFNNTNILNNTSTSFGGALANNASTITINGGLISGNSTSQTGGFIFGNLYSKLIINNCEISNNQAGTNGGAICVEGGSVELNNTNIINNQATAKGGALYAGFGKVKDSRENKYDAYETEVKIVGGTLNANRALSGGAIYSYTPQSQDVGLPTDGKTFYQKSITINSCVISNNSAEKASIICDRGDRHGFKEVNFTNCVFNNNLSNDEEFDIAECDFRFTGCELNNVKIYLHDNNILMENCNISGNSTYDGGVLCADARSICEINNCTIFNAVTSGNGGFAIISYSELTIRNSKFYNCSATAGGGVIAQTGGTIEINGCEFYSNTAGVTGGAIYKNGGTLNITNTKIYNNTASGSGGAIQCDGGDITLTGVEMYGNKSQEGNGSAICANDGSIVIEDGTSIYNHTSTVAGGAIRIGVTSTLTMNGGEIKNNTAGKSSATASYGGGVYVSAGGKFVMNGGTIHNNKVTATYSFGGNVYIDKSYTADDGTVYNKAEFEFKGGVISGDGTTKQAMVGGGIAVFGEFTMSGGTISGCVAQVGGGIANIGSSTLNGGTISGCVANNDAGNNSRAVANNGTLYLGNITLASGQDLAMGYQKVSSFISTPFPEGYGNLIVCETLTNTYNITFVQVTGTLSAKISTGTTAINRFTSGTVFATYQNGATVDASKFTTSGYQFYVSNGNVYMQAA